MKALAIANEDSKIFNVNKNGLHVTCTGTAIKIEITIEASKDSKVAHFANRYYDNNYTGYCIGKKSGYKSFNDF